MSEAMRIIVDRYVRSKNRGALEDLRMHRHRLKVNLFLHGQERRYNVGLTIQSLDGDLAAIEAGLGRLDLAVAAPDLAAS
jgi:hypothetical protein